MAWSEIGNSSSASEVAEKLNDFRIGSSATISLNAARNSFVIWANAGNPDPNKNWKALARIESQEEIAEIMDEKNLDPNCAIVSLDAGNKWQLWGFVPIE